MGELADRVQAMRVRASTPDGMMTAELRNGSEVALSLVPGWYDNCHESDLERQLTRLGSLLWVARTREYWATVSNITGEHVAGEDRPISPRDVEFTEARETVVARGRSTDGHVTLSVEGMRRWTVTIAPGTVRGLSERDFVNAVRQAASGLIQDQLAQITALKYRIYG